MQVQVTRQEETLVASGYSKLAPYYDHLYRRPGDLAEDAMAMRLFWRFTCAEAHPGCFCRLNRPWAPVRVIDLGCGTGWFYHQLRTACGAQMPQYVGVDVARGMIQEAQRKAQATRPHRGDAPVFWTANANTDAGENVIRINMPDLLVSTFESPNYLVGWGARVHRVRGWYRSAGLPEPWWFLLFNAPGRDTAPSPTNECGLGALGCSLRSLRRLSEVVGERLAIISFGSGLSTRWRSQGLCTRLLQLEAAASLYLPAGLRDRFYRHAVLIRGT